MNLIRLDDFEVDLRFQVASVEIFEDPTRFFLKSETDFRILRIVS
jgi:hypothetical protein